MRFKDDQITNFYKYYRPPSKKEGFQEVVRLQKFCPNFGADWMREAFFYCIL